MLGAVALSQVFGFGNHASAGARLRKRKMDGLFFRRDFDLLHPLQLFDPALHLLGLGGLIAEAIDKRLKLVNLFFLVAVSGLKLRAALGLLRQIFFVIAGIEENLLVPYLGGFLHGYV